MENVEQDRCVNLNSTIFGGLFEADHAISIEIVGNAVASTYEQLEAVFIAFYPRALFYVTLASQNKVGGIPVRKGVRQEQLGVKLHLDWTTLMDFKESDANDARKK